MSKYLNAPIVEAVFNIKITPPLAMHSKEIEALHPQLSEFYPEKEAQRTFQTTLKIKDGVPSSTVAEDKGIVGYRFWDSDRKQVCSFGMDSFSFSRLKPYDNWEKHFSDAMKSWGVYKGNLTPHLIKRVAVRFINVIEIPAVKFKLEDYLEQPPKPPKSLPQNLSGFLSRLMIKYDDGPQVIVTSTLQEPQKPNVTPILLDIDTFTDVSLSPDNEESLHILFDRLRTIKNDVFEAYLTPKAKELFG